MKSKPIESWATEPGRSPESPRYSDADIDKIISAAGGLPTKPFKVQELNQDSGRCHFVPRDRRETLGRWLADAAERFFIDRRNQTRPSNRSVAERLDRVSKAADNLLRELGLSDKRDADSLPLALRSPLRRRAEELGKQLLGFKNHPPETYPMENWRDGYVDYKGAEQLGDDIEGVQRLAKLAADAANLERARLKIRPDAPATAKDQAMQRLIDGLQAIYLEIFEQLPRTSVGGPTSEHPGKPTGPLIRFMLACLSPLGIKVSADGLRDRIRVKKPGGKTPSRMGNLAGSGD